MKRKILIIAPIVVCLLGIGLFLILYFNIPRLTYTYYEEADAYYVDKAYGNAKKYTIPETYKNKRVIGIDERAFYKHSNLREIYLPKSISTIKRLAFSECKRLEVISLENVETISQNAFSYCKKLNDLTISAKNIGGSAFYRCEKLDNVILLEGVEYIGSMAFSGTRVKEISLPRSTKEIGFDCFYECFALRNINVYGPNLTKNEYLRTLNIVTYIG